MASVDLLEQKPDHGKRVEVAKGAEPAGREEDTEKAEEKPVKTLTQRMAEIRREAYGIGKDNIKMKTQAGSEFTIKGHTIEAVLAEIRPLLDRHGVWMQPNLAAREYIGNRCDVMVDFYFESLDNGDDRKVIRWAGSGTDNSDKGFSKAGTNALKEMLKKVFLITDREDAKEEEDQVEFRSEQGATRAEVEEANEKTRAALEQWAKTFKQALLTAKDVKSVERLERENKDQLINAPDVTREFFVDLIIDRKAKLPKDAGKVAE